jgi:hypothetical protein
LNRNESGRFGALKSDSTHHFFRSHCGSKVPAVTVTVFKYRNKIGKIVVKAGRVEYDGTSCD